MNAFTFPIPVMDSRPQETLPTSGKVSGEATADCHSPGLCWLFFALLVPAAGILGCGILAGLAPEIAVSLFGGLPSGGERIEILALILSPMVLVAVIAESVCRKVARKR